MTPHSLRRRIPRRQRGGAAATAATLLLAGYPALGAISAPEACAARAADADAASLAECVDVATRPLTVEDEADFDEFDGDEIAAVRVDLIQTKLTIVHRSGHAAHAVAHAAGGLSTDGAGVAHAAKPCDTKAASPRPTSATPAGPEGLAAAALAVEEAEEGIVSSGTGKGSDGDDGLAPLVDAVSLMSTGSSFVTPHHETPTDDHEAAAAIAAPEPASAPKAPAALAAAATTAAVLEADDLAPRARSSGSVLASVGICLFAAVALAVAWALVVFRGPKPSIRRKAVDSLIARTADMWGKLQELRAPEGKLRAAWAQPGGLGSAQATSAVATGKPLLEASAVKGWSTGEAAAPSVGPTVASSEPCPEPLPEPEEPAVPPPLTEGEAQGEEAEDLTAAFVPLPSFCRKLSSAPWQHEKDGAFIVTSAEEQPFCPEAALAA